MMESGWVMGRFLAEIKQGHHAACQAARQCGADHPEIAMKRCLNICRFSERKSPCRA